MKRNIVFSLVAIGAMLLINSSCQQRMQKLSMPKEGLTFAFYNVENLFDTINDPSINDEEFLPDGKNNWDTKKYNHKLAQMARVIAAMDTLSYPDMLGLAEVENKKVLEDLVKQPAIKAANYQIIHLADNDPRGIEVAMLYRSEFFKPASIKAMQIVSDTITAPLRHILYVKGTVATGDTLHLFVNHWASRYGGEEATKGRRWTSGLTIRHLADSLFAINPNSNILIAGDLNDNPTDPSLVEFMQAKNPAEGIQAAGLYNLSLKPYSKGEGTLYYKGWDLFDQVIASSNLLKPAKGQLQVSDLIIISRPWMLFQPKEGDARPNRTLSGSRYFGGYSDHLPVMVRLTENK